MLAYVYVHACVSVQEQEGGWGQMAMARAAVRIERRMCVFEGGRPWE